jgi:hypothetical protein
VKLVKHAPLDIRDSIAVFAMIYWSYFSVSSLQINQEG